MFKKGIYLLAFVFSLVGQAQAAPIAQSDPYTMIKEVGGITFARLKKEQPIIQDNPDHLRKVMEEELLPYVDYKFSAGKVLGKHFRAMSKAKRIEFIKVFREYLVVTYSLALSYYNGQDVIFAPPKPIKKNSVTVRAIIKGKGRPDINIAFKVRKSKKSNQWKAWDMTAEGISMLSSKRSEFESILRKEGVDVVIAKMREKIAQPLELETENEQD